MKNKIDMFDHFCDESSKMICPGCDQEYEKCQACKLNMACEEKLCNPNYPKAECYETPDGYVHVCSASCRYKLTEAFAKTFNGLKAIQVPNNYKGFL